MTATTTRPAMLVTGGAKRLGASIARAFGMAGWHVVIHYRSSGDAAAALARELPSAQTVACDLADGDAAVAMVERLARSIAGLARADQQRVDFRTRRCNRDGPRNV